MQQSPIHKKTHHRNLRSISLLNYTDKNNNGGMHHNQYQLNTNNNVDKQQCQQQQLMMNPEQQHEHGCNTKNVGFIMHNKSSDAYISNGNAVVSQYIPMKNSEYRYGKISNNGELAHMNRSQVCLPQLRKSHLISSDVGAIKKQQLGGSRYSKVLSPDSAQFIDNSSTQPQKPHNCLALSLMGIKRVKANKSCMQQSYANKHKQTGRTSHQLQYRQSMAELQRQIDRDMAASKTSKIAPYRNGGSDNNNSNNRIVRQSGDIEIYQHADYPFRADDIRHLKQQIQHTVKQKWEVRNSNYTANNQNSYKSHNKHGRHGRHGRYVSKNGRHSSGTTNKLNKAHNNEQCSNNQSSSSSSSQYSHHPHMTNATIRKHYKQLQVGIYNNNTIHNINNHINSNNNSSSKSLLTISHKTSLSQLKQLSTLDRNTVINKHLSISIPSFFINPPSQFTKFMHSPAHGNAEQVDSASLHMQVCYLFSTMHMQIADISVKKYSNCFVIVNGNICIVWHTESRKSSSDNNKRYFGGWHNKYFDEGVKQGLGLQWVPNKYVYYGQFQNNKRHGFGVMKTADQQINIGFWSKGRPVSFGIEKNAHHPA